MRSLSKLSIIVGVMISGLLLASCAAGSKLDTAFKVATATITNPVGPVNMYQVKNVYAAGDQLVVDYRKYCWNKPYADILKDPIAKPVCQNRRATVRSLQSYRRTASTAINTANTFIRDNPTISATTLIGAAWDAVTAYRNAVPVVK